MGETEIMSLWPAFVTGCACWLYIVWELYYGEAAGLANQLSVDEAKKFLQQMEEREQAELRVAEQALIEQSRKEEEAGIIVLLLIFALVVFFRCATTGGSICNSIKKVSSLF